MKYYQTKFGYYYKISNKNVITRISKQEFLRRPKNKTVGGANGNTNTNTNNAKKYDFSGLGENNLFLTRAQLNQYPSGLLAIMAGYRDRGQIQTLWVQLSDAQFEAVSDFYQNGCWDITDGELLNIQDFTADIYTYLGLPDDLCNDVIRTNNGNTNTGNNTNTTNNTNNNGANNTNFNRKSYFLGYDNGYNNASN